MLLWVAAWQIEQVYTFQRGYVFFWVKETDGGK